MPGLVRLRQIDGSAHVAGGLHDGEALQRAHRSARLQGGVHGGKPRLARADDHDIVGVLLVELGDFGRLLQKARAHVGRSVLGSGGAVLAIFCWGAQPASAPAPAAVMAARPPNLNRSRRETFIPLVMMGPFPSLVTPSFSESSVGSVRAALVCGEAFRFAAAAPSLHHALWTPWQIHASTKREKEV